MSRISRFGGMLCGALALAATQTAAARELTFAIGLPPNHTWSQTMKYVADRLPEATSGALTAETYYGSLLNLKQSLTGLRDGVADVGMIVPGYHPAELPDTNLIIDLAMLGKDGIVLSAAVSDYMFNCDPCLQEAQAQGSTFVAMTANAPYMLQTIEPMTKPEDLKGKKIRSFSAFGRWAEYVGAIKMSMSANDIYDALSRGTLDANLHPAAELYNLNFADVVQYVTRLPLGTYNGNQFQVNNDVWRSLTTEQRRVILDLFGEAAAHTAVDFQVFSDHVLDVKAPENGIEVLEPSPELVALTNEFIEQDLKSLAAETEKNYGITDAAEKIETFEGYIQRWRDLLGEIDHTDKDAVADLFHREIWSKLDAATYGMQ